MAKSPTGASDDPAFREKTTQEAAGYLVEMLAALSHFAHRADLSNSSVMLATAAHVIEQECRQVTRKPPLTNPDADPAALFPFFPLLVPSLTNTASCIFPIINATVAVPFPFG